MTTPLTTHLHSASPQGDVQDTMRPGDWAFAGLSTVDGVSPGHMYFTTVEGVKVTRWFVTF